MIKLIGYDVFLRGIIGGTLKQQAHLENFNFPGGLGINGQPIDSTAANLGSCTGMRMSASF